MTHVGALHWREGNIVARTALEFGVAGLPAIDVATARQDTDVYNLPMLKSKPFFSNVGGVLRTAIEALWRQQESLIIQISDFTPHLCLRSAKFEKICCALQWGRGSSPLHCGTAATGLSSKFKLR